ncbi:MULTISPECIES: hypothetical protein [Pseudomonas]|uniref:hypothetical protein n=1 Tax=Pseudomonas TaxID=286 RepID=UPI0023DF7F08|nr:MULTISPECIES: hypothetical protein [Pseudomonas]MDF3239972.1 hypothetical protein [Pseudomonas veronii]
MVNAVSLPISGQDFKSIPAKRSLGIFANAQDFGRWIGVDYLILCTEHCPMWVAKIDEILMPREEGGPLIFRFTQIRSIAGMGGDPSYEAAFKSFRSSQHNPTLVAFDDASFFTIGEVVPFQAQPDTLGPFSMDEAIRCLAKTYGVGVDQVDITIRSRPQTAEADH